MFYISYHCVWYQTCHVWLMFSDWPRFDWVAAILEINLTLYDLGVWSDYFRFLFCVIPSSPTLHTIAFDTKHARFYWNFQDDPYFYSFFGGHLGFGDLEKRGSMDFLKFCSTSLAGVPRIPKIPTRPRSRNFLLNLISNPVCNQKVEIPEGWKSKVPDFLSRSNQNLIWVSRNMKIITFLI